MDGSARTHLAAIIVQHLCPLPFCHLFLGRGRPLRGARRSTNSGSQGGTHTCARGRPRPRTRLRRRPSRRRRSEATLRSHKRRGDRHARRRRLLKGRKDARLRRVFVFRRSQGGTLDTHLARDELVHLRSRHRLSLARARACEHGCRRVGRYTARQRRRCVRRPRFRIGVGVGLRERERGSCDPTADRDRLRNVDVVGLRGGTGYVTHSEKEDVQSATYRRTKRTPVRVIRLARRAAAGRARRCCISCERALDDRRRCRCRDTRPSKSTHSLAPTLAQELGSRLKVPSWINHDQHTQSNLDHLLVKESEKRILFLHGELGKHHTSRETRISLESNADDYRGAVTTGIPMDLDTVLFLQHTDRPTS